MKWEPAQFDHSLKTPDWTCLLCSATANVCCSPTKRLMPCTPVKCSIMLPAWQAWLRKRPECCGGEDCYSLYGSTSLMTKNNWLHFVPRTRCMDCMAVKRRMRFPFISVCLNRQGCVF